ncbi:hypothetical protein [Streptococcus agalactiae]|uniref:DUF2726 domain-containing protein n=1 Tax=Streptococcus agalactiae TaxID=1311 RepID=A0A8B4RAT5_STRAG|nr:hypothetical protein [Streptococcus agalactiae]SUN13113.1 Uncharacterised protein [Streptococcus agalactiae]
MAKYTKKEVERLIKEINSDYEFTGEYINNATPLRLRHIICGNTIERTLGNFKRTQKCPHCQDGRNKWNTQKVKVYIDNETNGEYSLVSEYKHFKKYIVVRHNDCIDKSTLPFDFAIIDEGAVIGLIEYDGIQHFRGWGNNKDDLLSIQKRDEIKNNYCYINKIPLFRINYKSYNKLENKIKEAINWIRQQNMLKKSSLETF